MASFVMHHFCGSKHTFPSPIIYLLPPGGGGVVGKNPPLEVWHFTCGVLGNFVIKTCLNFFFLISNKILLMEEKLKW